MSTTYHSAIASDAYETSDTFNAPLEQLDAQLVAQAANIATNTTSIGQNTTAIGTAAMGTAPDGTTPTDIKTALSKLNPAVGLLASLATTAKSSLAGALNELKARDDGQDSNILANTTAIGSASMGTAPDNTTPADIKTAVSKLNTAVGLLSGFAGGTFASVQAAYNALRTTLLVAHNSDGTIKNGAVSAAAIIADGLITGAKIAAGTISGSNIATKAFTPTGLIVDPTNAWLPLGARLDDGKDRHANVANLSIVASDPNNPSGGNTLVVGTTSTFGGHIIYPGESGLVPGDTITLWSKTMSPSGGTYVAGLQFRKQDGTLIGSQVSSAALNADGTVQYGTVSGTIPSLCYQVWAVALRSPNSANINIFEMQVEAGAFASQSAGNATAPGPAMVARRRNIMPDPLQQWLSPLRAIGGKPFTYNMNGTHPAVWTPNDPTHPRVGGGSVVITDFPAGWYIYPKNMQLGEQMTFYAEATAPSGSYNLNFRGVDATGAFVGSQVSGKTVTMSGTTQLLEVTGNITASTAVGICLYAGLLSGTNPLTVWDRWGGPGLQARRPEVDEDTPWLLEEARFQASGGAYAPHGLMVNWFTALAKIQQAVAGAQAVIAFIGDSWVWNDYIRTPLNTALQTLYGDAGVGYVPAGAGVGGSLPAAPPGAAVALTGTWASSDQLPTSRDVAISNISTMDGTATCTLTLNPARADFITLEYIATNGGAQIQYVVDNGAPVIVDTNNGGAAAYASTPITTTDATHTIIVSVRSIGTAGLTLLGFATKRATVNGVRINKIGNPGANASQYVSVDATIWESGLGADVPNLAIIELGTNDDAGEIDPVTFGSNIRTLVARIRAVAPNASILLLAPAWNALTPGTYPIGLYTNVLHSLAISLGCACVDLSNIVPPYATDSSVWSNTSHLNEVGGQMGANALVKVLKAQ